MAHFPATVSEAGVLSASDKAKLDNLNISSQVQIFQWFHLLPQPASSGTPSNATSTSSSYSSKARFLFDFGRLNLSGTSLSGKMYVNGYVSGAGLSGNIRLYNVTDGIEMGLITYTETAATIKTVALTSIPTSGIKIVEIQMRRITPGTTITVVSASADFVLTAI